MTTIAGAASIDLLSPASFAGGQPHDQFRWLRTNDPVYWHPEPDGAGYWALTRYEHVKAVGRDPETYSSAPSIMIADPDPGMGTDDHQMMLTMDPPRHGVYRHLVLPDFMPRAARAMGPNIRALAKRIVDRVAEAGECDLVEDMAGLMPSYVIAEILGIPPDRGHSRRSREPGTGRRLERGARNVQLRPWCLGGQVRSSGGRPGDEAGTR
jgi:cytochrome P450